MHDNLCHRGFYFFIVLLLVLTTRTGLAIEARDFDNDQAADRYYALIERLRCLVCQNQSLAESNAELAQDMRSKTYELMFKKKASDDDIVDFMVERYGDFVMYRPPFKLKTMALWLTPAIALLLGLVLVARLAAASSKNPAPNIDEKNLSHAKRLLSDHESGARNPNE